MNRDRYFYEITQAIATNSKCLSRKIGAVIVKDNKFIVSTGYNGPAANCQHCDIPSYRSQLFSLMFKDCKRYLNPNQKDDSTKCPRLYVGYNSGEGTEYCQAAHAERNAIAVAAKLGHPTEGCSLFLNSIIPCFECAKSIINAGLKEVIVTEMIDYTKEGITGKFLLEQAGIKIRKFEL